MSLVQDFCDNSAVRLAGIALAAFATVTSLTACDATLPKRVVTDSIIRGTLPARQEMKRDAGAALRFTQCANTNPAPQKPGIRGALERELTVSSVTFGDPSCGQNQQRGVDQNGVAPLPSR